MCQLYGILQNIVCVSYFDKLRMTRATQALGDTRDRLGMTRATGLG